MNGHEPSNWELKGAAIAGYTVATLRMYPPIQLDAQIKLTHLSSYLPHPLFIHAIQRHRNS